MSYSDLIRQEGEYTYSANVQFDLTTDTKLLRFIPNQTLIELLRDYFSDMTRACPSNHARILYGSYGTGKSHFLTVLGQVLSKTFTDGVAFETFIGRISEYDSELAHDIKSYVTNSSSKPLLIVPIVFDFDDFDRCIYFSLKKKLDSLGISVQYKNFYSQASNLLEQWQSSDDSRARLKDACVATKIDLGKLLLALEKLEPAAENQFNKLFEEMTFGVKYIYEASNMFEILNQTNISIRDQFSGIVFIFDEFGRYIEDNLKKIRVKAIQNLAEYCDHSEGNTHIILVSHKEISQYTEHQSKTISIEWKKVEGRYKSFSINNKQDQSFDIIRSILLKNEAVWNKFKSTFENNFKTMYAALADFNGFALADVQKNTYDSAFPLHPMALFVLDRLSKKVAQNDRTFFTYLASHEPNSLYRFLTRTPIDEFHYVGIDEIYDYFEPSIKSVQSDDTYEWYKSLQRALSKGCLDEYSDDLQVKVLKVITTIGIVNDPGSITANPETIINSIDAGNSDLQSAIDSLCNLKILKFSGLYQRYEFFDASIFDVSAMIEEESIRVNNEAIINCLNDNFVSFVLYPYQYNHEYKISRVFVPVFTSTSALSPKFLSQKLGRYYDGALLLTLCDGDTALEEVTTISKDLARSIVWLNPNTDALTENVRKFIAAKYLETQKSNYVSKDPAFDKELQYHLRESIVAIEKEIRAWKNYEGCEYSIIANGELYEDVKTFSQISQLAAEMMHNVYPDTLIVNNELINKNTISGTIASAKKNAIRSMLQSDGIESYYGLQYLSPDYIAVRSVLCMNGFACFGEKITINTTNDGYKPQGVVSSKIDEYIFQAQNGTVSFSDLYAELKSPPFGLRDGYMSLLFANKLLQFKKTLTISSHGSEQELTSELFEEIVKRPGDFCFTVATWTKSELDFIDSLESMFRSHIDTNKLSRNRLKAILEAMLSHYKSVSKFARTTTNYVSISTQQYRKLMEQNHNSFTHFFFVDAKNLTGDYEASRIVISESREELDNVLDVLMKDLKRDVTSTLTLDPDLPLAVSLRNKYFTEWEAKRIKSFDYYTNAFLDYMGRLEETFSDSQILTKLAKTLSGIEITYWSDFHKAEFDNRLKEICAKLLAYNGQNSLQNGETRMTLSTYSGNEKSVIFNNSELSDLDITIKNKIIATFGNFGLSVTYDDKVQILLSLLNDLMEGK